MSVQNGVSRDTTAGNGPVRRQDTVTAAAAAIAAASSSSSSLPDIPNVEAQEAVSSGIPAPGTGRPSDVGIIAMELYFPQRCVEQTELEKLYKVAPGKYTIGLGQTMMAFCDDREDIYSISLTVTQNLLRKNNIDPRSIGRLEVGTETLLDKSKSVKSVLMQLFSPVGNTDIEGVDTINACYGGTSALFNAVNWVESSGWDGRYAIVVVGDIALYAEGPARPTGGAGAVAMLVGPNAPFVVESALKGTYMEHAYDFYKPDLSSEYPIVDGHFSNECFLRALDTCYIRWCERYARMTGVDRSKVDRSVMDYNIFHAPYCKLVQKSFARLAYIDYAAAHDQEKYAGSEFEALRPFARLTPEESFSSKDVEKAFQKVTAADYKAKIMPTLEVATKVGNMYTASLYGCLASLVSNIDLEHLPGKRIGVFSYGSGLASSFFSIRVQARSGTLNGSVDVLDKLQTFRSTLDIHRRLKERRVVPVEEFEKITELRERTHNLKGYKPVGDIQGLLPGTFYLVDCDDKWRRRYEKA